MFEFRKLANGCSGDSGVKPYLLWKGPDTRQGRRPCLFSWVWRANAPFGLFNFCKLCICELNIDKVRRKYLRLSSSLDRMRCMPVGVCDGVGGWEVNVEGCFHFSLCLIVVEYGQSNIFFTSLIAIFTRIILGAFLLGQNRIKTFFYSSAVCLKFVSSELVNGVAGEKFPFAGSCAVICH